MNDISIPPSLDFPGRVTLTVQEIARRLSCSVGHIKNLIGDGTLHKVKSAARATQLRPRVAIEDYRTFLLKRCTSKQPVFSAAEVPWPSMDFPATRALSPEEIAKTTGCSRAQIQNLIRDAELAAFDLKRARSSSTYFRIPVEAYRQFINQRIIRPQRDSLAL